MHEAGAATLAQDQHTSVVWGMPQAAVKRGGVDRVLSLARIPEQILSLVAD
jgi:two-component system chemotaxis response regulator CheB